MANSARDSKYSKNDILEVEIIDIGTDGEGIGKIDGYTLFIKDAVIGDKVKAKIMKAKKNYAYAHLEEVITPSSFRIDPACKIARQCGGCQIQNMSYERQLQFKQDKVRNNIVRLGGFEASEIDSKMEPIIGMDEPFRYRNKAQYPVGTDKNGNIIIGFYAGHSHNIIPCEDCLIGITENKIILDIIKKHMEENHILPYSEETGKGLVRHILIRKGFTSDEIMVCIVINYNADNKNVRSNDNAVTKSRDKRNIEHKILKTEALNNRWIPNQDKLTSMLSKVSGMESISVSINTERSNVIMGTEIHTIWGKDTISDTLCGLKFNISPLSFYQVNPVQTEKLYRQAIEYAGLTGKETVWDLYCGIGTITLAMSKDAKHVYGVEIIPQAIDDARENAKANKIENADFYVGKAEEVLPDLYEKEGIFADVICIDPPRKGCDQAALDTMLKMSPERIVYVSCDSATLARDLRILCDGGYRIEKIR
ncbi:MAG: 23S rRNA (uracil(1939)-C(5))-methyltransferase RlmD, partial [Butyrivibrio sp.]|nr:23S rRNA (uracil(1939)-C(5))-methyltransferase RlmD [Butyrivibrio sp.]